ncbi:hypothetical protein WA158_005190 [Blastocystis sp. Blastoise]
MKKQNNFIFLFIQLKMVEIFECLKTVVVVLCINIYCFLYGFYTCIVGKGNVYYLCIHLTDILGAKEHLIKGAPEIAKGKVMFLCNHRSWADFFVDSVAVGGASYLSRLMVIVGVPGPAFVAWMNNFVWFFHRKRGISREWLTHFFEEHWKTREQDGCVVYPEGHRFVGKGTLKLKTGVLEVAYNMNVPVQILLTANKEVLLNEKELKFQFGTNLISNTSKVLMPHDYGTKEEWFDAVHKIWDEVETELEAKKDDANNYVYTGYPLPGRTIEDTHYYPVNSKARIIVFSIFIAIFMLYFL